MNWPVCCGTRWTSLLRYRGLLVVEAEAEVGSKGESRMESGWRVVDDDGVGLGLGL